MIILRKLLQLAVVFVVVTFFTVVLMSEFIRDAKVNTQVFGTAFRQRGHFEDRADILTLAYSHSF